jgi:hypothetical protein
MSSLPGIRFEYPLHPPCRGREEGRAFAAKFRRPYLTWLSAAPPT